jgi:hypothetical protein
VAKLKLPQGKRTRFKIIVEARDLNEVKEIVACEGYTGYCWIILIMK